MLVIRWQEEGTSKFVLIDDEEKTLSTFNSGSCNKNNIGFDNALKNVSDGIIGLLTAAKKEKSQIAGICLTTAGCTMNSDKEQWKAAIATFLEDKDQSVRIEVHNDSVGDVASVCPKTMSGIVCIVGTGFIVCGYNGDPNVEYRAGGWGPLFGDSASGYFMGEKVLKAAALYYDICGDAETRFVALDDEQKETTTESAQKVVDSAKNPKETESEKLVLEYGGSELLYRRVMKKAKVKQFPEMVDWAYNAEDKYNQVAACALLALESYGDCVVAKKIVENAVDAMIVRLILVLNKMHPVEVFNSGAKDKITVICGGSVMLKSDLFLDIVKRELAVKLKGDGRQKYIEFVRPQREPQLGGALYIKHKCETS